MAEVISAISAVIALLESSIKIYDSAQKDIKLPEIFETVRRRLPIILHTLSTCNSNLEKRIDSIPEYDDKVFEAIVKVCYIRAKNLNEIIQKIVPGESDTREQRYLRVLRRLGKGNKVEELMLGLIEDVQLLVNHDAVMSANRSQIARLEAIIDEMKSAISGPEEESSTTNFSNGDRPQTNNIQRGSGSQFDVSGGGQQYNAKTQNFVEIRQEEDFGFRRPVGVCLGQAPYMAPDLFVGRGSELDEITKVLYPGYELKMRIILVLGGIAGIGKTQLAIAYALSRSKSYSSVFWLDATSEATLELSFRQVASLIFEVQNSTVLDDKRIVERVHRWLSDPKNTRWLLIFDNYDDHGQFTISDYYPPISCGAIIVTTRQPDLVPSSTHILHIKAFQNIEDSLTVLQTRSKRQNTKMDPSARRVAERLEGVPLALVVAGTYLQRSVVSFERYLQEYEKHRRLNAYRPVELQEYPELSFNTILDVSHNLFKVANPQEYQEGCQSDLSNPSSAFSLQSMQSTTLTTDTHFSASELSTALDELVDIFMDDKELAPLYPEAIVERRITLARFVRNFRRLLKNFAADLKEESQEAIDIDLANLISSQARLLSDKIGSKLEQKFSQPDTTSMRLQETHAKDGFQSSPTKEFHNVSSDDEDEHEPERALDEKFVALVSHGRGFIEESTALQKLREEFKKFVIPPIQSREPEAKHFHKVQSWLHLWTHFWFTRTLGGGPKYEAQRLMMKTLSFFTWLLSEIGLLEKAVPENHQRIRWTNRHGRQLYDDYVEHRPGALKTLQDYLTSTTVPPDLRNVGPASSQGQSSSRAASMYTPNPRSLSIGVSTSNDTTVQSTYPASNIHTGITQNINLGESSTGPLLLLSCIERRGHPVKLHQELVTNVTDDRELFHSLNRAYHSHRTKFKSFWSLRTLHGIHFMKFGYGGHGLIDVRCHPEPCVLGKPCACIPPADRVFPQGKEYACQPIPSDLSPPIGPKAMMDYFKDPDSRIAGADWILQQLPKKIGAELDPNRADMSQAWGILYREDWDWMRIWIVLGVAFFPPSLLFGILWGILRQDIQGAFGVASWWMAGATIAIGIVGTCT